MNLTIARALLEDARQQVLDNKVFRLLLVVSLVPVAFTFLIGFHEDAISVLWGWEEIEYKKIFEAFGNVLPRDVSPRELMIQGLLSFLIENLAGTLGVIVSIAATAFFVPRMMEKGAADTLFSKPVSRLTLLLSRYFAGLLFIAALATFLVVGMYLGLLLTSGYNDPGMLWGIVTLVYLFALVHAFSISIATLTRSSTAAILLSILLFMFGGCLHDAWIIKEHAQTAETIQALREASEAAETEEQKKAAQDLGEAADVIEDKPTWLRMLVLALDTVHYVLPKTSDADIITSQLRKAVSGSGPVLEDPDGDLTVERDPEGYELVASTAGDIAGAGVRWVRTEGGEEQGLLVLRRSDRAYEDVAPDGRTRERRTSPNAAAREREEQLEGRAEVTELSRGREYVSGRQAASLRWVETQGGARTVHEHLWFGFADWLFELEMRWPEGSVEDDEHTTWRNDFLAYTKLGRAEFQMPGEWYRDQFGWAAPLPYNAFFSIGSSLAFAAAMIGLAWLRLKLTDF